MAMKNRSFGPKGRESLPDVLQSLGNHIVYAEGEKTEPLYVESVKIAIAENYGLESRKISIETVPESGGRNTSGLFEYAKKDYRKRIRGKQHFDGVWIFFDKDDFPKDRFDNTIQAVWSMNCKRSFDQDKGGNTDKYGARWWPCWSNESFEIWPIYHFENLSSALSRERYIEKINESLRNHGVNEEYCKNHTRIHQLLKKGKGRLDVAIKNSKKHAPEALNNTAENPSTGIFYFAEFFKRYIEKK